jgi:hypothetical protein
LPCSKCPPEMHAVLVMMGAVVMIWLLATITDRGGRR